MSLNSPPPPVTGRGRGRGRGMLSSMPSDTSPKPGPASPSKSEEERKPPAPVEVKATSSASSNVSVVQKEGGNNIEELKNILKAIDKLPLVAVYTQVIVKDMKSMNNEKDMEELVKLLCERAMKDPDYAKKAANMCNAIWNEESMHRSIRTPLLTVVQRFYTRREELRKERRDKYYGMSMFLCCLYKHLRLKGNSLKPLVTPIFTLLKELLGPNANDDDIGYFYQEFELVGAVMQIDDKMKLEQVLNMAREKVITGCKSPMARCQLVQAVELYAAGFKFSEETNAFYDDLLADIMSR